VKEFHPEKGSNIFLRKLINYGITLRHSIENINVHKNTKFLFISLFHSLVVLVSFPLSFTWIGFSDKIVSQGMFDKLAQQNRENPDWNVQT
jgi:hypothetical protein